jgi:hypothetical protein
MKRSNSFYKDHLRYVIDRDPRLMPATKRLLVRIIGHFNLETASFKKKNKDGSVYSAFPSPEYLEFWLGLNPVTVKRSTDEAYQCGWLVKDKDGIECLNLEHVGTIWDVIKEKKEAWFKASRKRRRTAEDLKVIEQVRREIEDAYRLKNLSVKLEGLTARAEASTRIEQFEARTQDANRTRRNFLEHEADAKEPYEQQRTDTDNVIPIGTLH